MLVNWVFGQPIAFSLTGLQLDLFQFIYDLLLTALMGFVVWKITSFWDEQRQIRSSFQREVQDLSRYVAALKNLVEAYPARKCDLEIEQLIVLSPRHESFVYLEKGYEVAYALYIEERSILRSISDDATEDGVFKSHGMKLSQIRCRVVGLTLPAGRLKSHFRERLDEQIARQSRELGS